MCATHSAARNPFSAKTAVTLNRARTADGPSIEAERLNEMDYLEVDYAVACIVTGAPAESSAR